MKPTHTLAFLALCAGLSLAAPAEPGAASNQHLDVHGVHGRDGISASGDVKAHVGRRKVAGADSNEDLAVDGDAASTSGDTNTRRNDIDDTIGDIGGHIVHTRDDISGSGEADASLSGGHLVGRQSASAEDDEDVDVHGVHSRSHVSGSADVDAH
ncbi:hypothetical protein ASPCADRAFT_509876 [Aspergillus carbonarius ITEM 5010]|uniref:Uncharacterized protein n=1 Tax=Aspergillus carbonarius (strain ITEM 5010) TaxID=602072 RepID=A0A1R3RBU5_ASPC5|nr:hypothetical protein ASPCADRAFT_509876 [Aspergillus carbonarius ITEM 5010]